MPVHTALDAAVARAIANKLKFNRMVYIFARTYAPANAKNRIKDFAAKRFLFLFRAIARI
jgi:hypothetical protein